jgi:release factor glutamine methyltransferase
MPMCDQQESPLGEMCSSVGAALAWATRDLAASGSATPRLDAELLLGHVLRLDRAQLHVRWQATLPSEVLQSFGKLIARRMAHEPVAYLIGKRAFYDVELNVDRRVLIPRPESELLIEEARAWCRGREDAPWRVVDVGTGSGALAVVLARRFERAQVWAVDISSDALRVAARNVVRYGLQQRIALVQGDLLSALPGPFDLVVANLPYIARPTLGMLAPDVVAYEPRLALDGGMDGLDLVRRLLAQLPERLAVPALVLLEIDDRQGEAVCALARAHWPTAQVMVLRDYAGLERVARIVL